MGIATKLLSPANNYRSFQIWWLRIKLDKKDLSSSVRPTPSLFYLQYFPVETTRQAGRETHNADTTLALLCNQIYKSALKCFNRYFFMHSFTSFHFHSLPRWHRVCRNVCVCSACLRSISTREAQDYRYEIWKELYHYRVTSYGNNQDDPPISKEFKVG